jgi:hypothetical protein
VVEHTRRSLVERPDLLELAAGDDDLASLARALRRARRAGYADARLRPPRDLRTCGAGRAATSSSVCSMRATLSSFFVWRRRLNIGFEDSPLQR